MLPILNRQAPHQTQTRTSFSRGVNMTPLKTDSSDSQEDEIIKPSILNVPPPSSPKSARAPRTPHHLRIVSGISDFFNSKQINHAVNMAETVSDRLKIVDLILERRNEIQEMESQMKLEKAAPIIRNFRQNFIAKTKTSVSRNSAHRLKASMISSIVEEDSIDLSSRKPSVIMPDRIESGTPKNRSPLNTNTNRAGSPSPFEDMLENNKDRLASDMTYYSPSSRQREGTSDYLTVNSTRRDSSAAVVASLLFDQFPTANFEYKISIKPPESTVIPRMERQKMNTIYSIMKFRSDNTPKFTKDQIMQQFKLLMTNKAPKEPKPQPIIPLKNLEPPVLKMVRDNGKKSMKKNLYRAASKRLESDLCRFMLKNEEEDRGIINTLGYNKSPKLREIEENALSQFESLVSGRATPKQKLNINKAWSTPVKGVSLTPKTHRIRRNY